MIAAAIASRWSERVRRFARYPLYRRALASIGIGRIVKGGRIRDMGRLPRYRAIFSLGAAAIWIPILAYLLLAKKQYASEFTLILPGAGVSTSVNLSDIGQATSSANSAYASTSLSPSVTYKNLLENKSFLKRTALGMHADPNAFGKPVIKLVDETSLITIKVTAPTAQDAARKGRALIDAFSAELDSLRTDEIERRDSAAAQAIINYRASVDATRAKISALQLQSGLTTEEQYSTIVGSAETLQSQLAETGALLQQKEGDVRSLSGMLRVSPQVAALTLKVQSDPEIGELADAVAKAAAATAELEKQYGPNHPKYQDALAREQGERTRMLARGAELSGLPVHSLGDQVDTTPKGERPALLARLVTDLVDRQGLAAQYRAQKTELEGRRQRIHDLVQIESQLDALNRDYKVADAVFASALARVNTAKADMFASYPMVQVVEQPTVPEKPSSPSLLIAVGAGVAATFFLVVGLALGWIRGSIINRIIARPEPPVEAGEA